MGQAIPRQHPAVVLRSHYRQLRALLALALIVLVGLAVALVMVANDDERTTTSTANPVQSIEYGSFNPATGQPMANDVTPDEASIAAAISGAQQAVTPGKSSGPDEANIASAIGNGTANPPVSQSHPGTRP
jgi:hypothetical protein